MAGVKLSRYFVLMSGRNFEVHQPTPLVLPSKKTHFTDERPFNCIYFEGHHSGSKVCDDFNHPQIYQFSSLNKGLQVDDPIYEVKCSHSQTGHSVVGSLVKDTMMTTLVRLLKKKKGLKYPNLKVII